MGRLATNQNATLKKKKKKIFKVHSKKEKTEKIKQKKK